MTQKRSVINWDDDQHKAIEKAAKAIGQTVPQYTKTATLEKMRAGLPQIMINAKDAT